MTNSPNDTTPAWVCELGGYDMLAHGSVEDAQRWYIRFGIAGHQPIIGGPFLAHEVKRYEVAVRDGFLWWGNPRGWFFKWPEAWSARLYDEFVQRMRFGMDHILARDAALKMALTDLTAEDVATYNATRAVEDQIAVPHAPRSRGQQK